MFNQIRNFLSSLNPANDPSFIGHQLKHPKGLFATKVAKGMNVSNKDLYDSVLSILDLKDADKILEVGFGNGYFFQELSRKNNTSKLYGIEISKEMISLCTKLNNHLIEDKKLEIRLTLSSALPYSDETFEKAIAINLIYFWENPIDNIKELNRVVKNQGELVIGIRPYYILRKLPFAQRNFNIQQDDWWIDLFEKSGFELTGNQSTVEQPLAFNGNIYEMGGVIWTFKKVAG